MPRKLSHDPLRLVGLNVRRLRIGAGLSQDELASRASLHRTYISSVERGARNLTVRSIVALADALDCEPSVLLQHIVEREPNGA